MAKCIHPFALVSVKNPREPFCTKCRTILPAVSFAFLAPADLVTPVREFLRLLRSAEAGDAQMSPRLELQLILAMADALHALDKAAEADRGR